mmetsp:Transcript_37865/g.59854  ORF Transcript_37865/g.59854 Transcript_37865/m.59854 type:complete len:764 (-) Transcript_37865:80-2371(-)
MKLGRYCSLLLFFFLFLASISEAQENDCEPYPDGIRPPAEVTIGGLAVLEGKRLSAVTRLAVQLVNEDPCILPETRLNIIEGFDNGEPVLGMKEFLRIQGEHNPVGWVGIAFSDVARAIALTSPLSETPIISASATISDLSDGGVYPYFSRVVPSDASQGRLLADLCDHYGWDRVAVISTSNVYGSSIVEQFTNRAASLSIQFLCTSTFPLETEAESREDYLDQIRSTIRKTKASGARIILLACLFYESSDYFRIAIEEGLVGSPYTYITSNAVDVEAVAQRFLEDEDLGNLYGEFQDVSQGVFVINPQGVQPGPIADQWVNEWLTADPDIYFGAGDIRFAFVPFYALYRDAVYCMAYAIDRLIRRGIDPSDGNALLEAIQKDTDFEGLTGRIRFNENGDRFAQYDIRNSQDFSLKMTVIGSGSEDGLKFKKQAVFSDGTTNIPDAAERIYVDWDDVEAILMLSLFSVGLIVTLGCLLVMMVHRSTPIMNYSSPRFAFGTAVGVLIGFANVFVWTGEPTSGTCEARPWLLVLNFVFIFGHICAKAFRFLYVMKQRKTLHFRPIPDIHLFVCVLSYVLLFVIPVIVWTVEFPLDVTRSDSNPDNDKVNIICDGDNSEVFLGVLMGLGGLSLIVGVVVAFLNRNYHDFFSEATYIGYTMFTVCVTCCVVLPMLFILSDTPLAFYTVLMLGIFLSNGAVLVFMFFPKIYVIFHPDKNVVPLDAKGSLKTKKSASSVFGSKRTEKKSSSVAVVDGQSELKMEVDMGV